MPFVTFFGGPMTEPVRCSYAPQAAQTLLALARANDIPLEWTCTRGTCGHCAARVTVVDGEQPPVGTRERNVLAREGFAAAPTTVAARWRLACRFPLSGADLRVEW